MLLVCALERPPDMMILLARTTRRRPRCLAREAQRQHNTTRRARPRVRVARLDDARREVEEVEARLAERERREE